MEINSAVTFKHDRSPMYNKRPKVLIVGAGLAGLTLGMLLHKANIPFEIYERAAEVKPLGSAMAFSATTANLFKQCGIYDEFVSISKLSSVLNVCNEQRESEYKIDFRGHDEMFGAKGYIVTRPKLYDLLLRQVPQERIHLGKKILSMENGVNGVLIRCSDGSEAEGDILVGADGAYSAVRQNLYAKMLKDKRLPPSDALPLPFSTVCLVGQTRPLTPEEFPDVALEECQFRNVVGNNRPYAGPEAAAAMAAQVRDFPVVSGGDKKLTLGDLIDRTPKELMSKAMQEEKVFKTWFDCRTVLIGDAGGLGATNAMHDALVLANLINGLPFHPVANEIEAAFKAYREERCHWVKDAYEASKIFKTMAGQKMMAKVVRFCVKNMPQWVFQQGQNRTTCNRPQCAFLPLIQDTGRVRPAPQPSLSVKTPKDPENNEDKVEAIPAAAAAI
ncbi:hypothetical protein BGZ90_003109 [Linnemannia elongata]|nr:hypothetical protein BGZ90_003109 [Linnemannia elongata]